VQIPVEPWHGLVNVDEAVVDHHRLRVRMILSHVGWRARDTVAAISGSFWISWVPEVLSSIATLVGCMAIPAFAGAHPAKQPDAE
jgi:hypothetical protein